MGVIILIVKLERDYKKYFTDVLYLLERKLGIAPFPLTFLKLTCSTPQIVP